MKKLYYFLMFCFLHSFVYSQTEAELISFSIEEIYEQLASEADEDIDLTALLEDLYYLSENPINLNIASRTQLQKLSFLSTIQIQELLDYPKLHGDFLSVYELSLLKSFDKISIQRILPFISLTRIQKKYKLSAPSVLRYGRHQILMRYQQLTEQQQGYSPISDSLLSESPNSRYLGNAAKLYARYRFQYHDNISIGFTGEKDAGEEFFTGSQKQGFDFNSAHFFYQNKGFVKQIALGDFHARFGQGLIFWTGYSFGKSLDNISSVERNQPTIRPYTSTDENNFLRGAATTVGWKHLELTTFYSTKNIDGNKITNHTDENQEEVYISSFQESGIHSTVNEMADRKSLQENIFGSSLKYHGNKAKLSLNFVHAKYGDNIQRNIQAYNQFYFHGDNISNLSLAYRFKLWRLNIFGETAINDNSTIASINGLSVSINSATSFVLVNRYYPAKYYAVKPNSFGDKQGSQNEIGTYMAFEIVPMSKLKFTTWFDNYSFPWLRFGTDAPSKAYEYAMQLNYFHNYDFQMYARVRYENSEGNFNQENTTTVSIQSSEKQSIRLHLQYKILSGLTLKNRIEYVNLNEENTNNEGWLMYQDISYGFKNLPLKLYIRYALFDTDGWDSRVYAWENDVLYAFSVPAMYSKGTRSYFMAKYKINNNADFWFRISQTNYSDKNEIGSNLTLISDNTKTEVKLMLRLKF